MSKFQDIASMEIDETRDTAEAAPEIMEDGQPKKGEKQYLKFKDGEVLLVTDYVNNLSFADKFQLLFGKNSDEKKKTDKEATISEKLTHYVKIFLGIAIMVVILQLAVVGMKQSDAARNQNLQNNLAKEEVLSNTIQTVTAVTISKAVEREISLYNNEEVKKIEDYLSMRGNRGATMTSIRMQRAKKENTYLFLAQNRYLFEEGETEEEIAEKLAQYDKLENKIIESIVLSEDALAAFDNRSTSTILKYLVPLYHRV